MPLLSGIFCISLAKLCIQHFIMSISSTGVFAANYVLQRAYEFAGEKQWANSEFFETLERAELYAIQMKPFWVDMKEYRIIPVSNI